MQRKNNKKPSQQSIGSPNIRNSKTQARNFNNKSNSELPKRIKSNNRNNSLKTSRGFAPALNNQRSGIQKQKKKNLFLHKQNAYKRNKKTIGFFNYRKAAPLILFCILLTVLIIVLLTAALKNESNTEASLQDKTFEYNNNEDEQTQSVNAAPLFSYTDNTKVLTTEIDSEKAIMVDLSSNQVLCEKASREIMYPASLTKVLTLLVAVENTDDLNDTFTMTSSIIDPLYIKEASLSGFKNGESVTINDLLYGLTLPSGADAAAALTIYIAGTENKFVDMMNDKVKELGLENTHFTNPTGLHDDNQYTTAYDMAVIMKAAMENPTCAKVLSAYQYTTAKTEQNPEGVLLTSDLFKRMYGDEPDKATVIAGKTGYTKEAKNTLVTYAVDDENQTPYICVFGAAKTMYKPVFDCIRILSDYRICK